MSICLVLVVVGLSCHSYLLRWATIPLRRSDFIAADAELSELVLLRSTQLAPSTSRLAADFVSGGADRRVVVFRDYVRRDEAIGAAPSFSDGAIDKLTMAGVPASRIDVLHAETIVTYGDTLSVIANRLTDQPTQNIMVVTHSFHTGYLKDVAAKVLSPELRERIRIVGCDRVGVDASNWYRSPTGVKFVIQHALQLVHLWCFGEFQPDITWDPDQYESELRAMKAHE